MMLRADAAFVPLLATQLATFLMTLVRKGCVHGVARGRCVRGERERVRVGFPPWAGSSASLACGSVHRSTSCGFRSSRHGSLRGHITTRCSMRRGLRPEGAPSVCRITVNRSWNRSTTGIKPPGDPHFGVPRVFWRSLGLGFG